MKTVTQTRRVIRVVPQIHRAIKAAAEDRPPAVMADDILAEALEKRCPALEKNQPLVATLATCVFRRKLDTDST